MQSNSPANTSSAQDSAPETQDKTTQQQPAETASSGSRKRQKSRHRASVACASCRDRRIRCVVPPGESECTQCKRSGVECIIKNDDERRRPISRAYMSSLTDRVALLESMLKEQGTEPPPAQYPPKTRHGLPRDENPATTTSNKPPSITQEQSSPGSQQDDFVDLEQFDQENNSQKEEEGDSAASPPALISPRKDGIVSRLLSTRGHLSFDQLSGRLRYFGPTTNCHVHSDFGPVEETRESIEQARRAEKIIRSLSFETYDYLMELFWQYYNSVLHVLHQEAFNEDKDSGRTQFYSGFLHVCVLAMGFRFADKSRADMQRISLPSRESTLHREAKYMLDSELERPGGIPSVIALLLLGDLECGVGRDNVGWLYGGMAVRLAFDIGLHLDSRMSGLPEREVDIRHMTLWACVIYDKYWALFLGRPTSMKSSDLEIYTLSKQFERLGTCRPAGPQKNLETQIYEALLDLMELAGKITENMDPRAKSDPSIDRNAYLRMAALDRELSTWYSRLPEPLRWTQTNIDTAPFSFFLLHQQYHCALILLHRPFAMYEEPSGSDSDDPDNHFSALSRTVCTKHAIRVARIFWQHRQRFDTKQIFVTGMQHAGTAATALVAALAFLKDSGDRNNNMQYLECLAAALQDMSYTYQPAERMSVVLQAVMAELRGIPADSVTALYRTKGSLVPARRGSSVDESEHFAFKRRQTSISRPRARAGSKAKRSSSFTPLTLDMGFGSVSTPMHKPDAEFNQQDGFIMVTPRSEIASWPPSGKPDASPVIDPSLPTPTATTIATPAPRNCWMGAEFEPADINALASVHFPEIPNISDNGQEHGTGLDFMTALTIANDDWRDWQPGPNGINTDLDGFQPSSAFAAGIPGSPEKFAGIMTG